MQKARGQTTPRAEAHGDPRTGRYSGTPLARAHRLPLPASHRLWGPVPGDFAWLRSHRPWVLQPRGHKDLGLGWHRFARRYSGDLKGLRPMLISLPPGTEMFQFPGFASLAYTSDPWGMTPRW